MTKLLYTKPALVLFDARGTALASGAFNDAFLPAATNVAGS